MNANRMYQLGRALAAERDAKLDHYGEPEAENCARREAEIADEISANGGWTDDVQRGYDDACADYAAERTPW